MLQEVFDEMLTFASAGTRRDALQAARRSYEQHTGEIFESDASFERRIAAFLEWYVLDAPQADGEPPIVHFVRATEASLPEDRRRALHAWRGSRVSLFEVRKCKDTAADITDLLTGGRHHIAHASQLLGCDSGVVFVARMLEDQGSLTLTDGVVYLPAGGNKRAKAAAKALRKKAATPKEQLQLMLRLAFLTNRCERYRHVDPKSIFEDLP